MNSDHFYGHPKVVINLKSSKLENSIKKIRSKNQVNSVSNRGSLEQETNTSTHNGSVGTVEMNVMEDENSNQIPSVDFNLNENDSEMLRVDDTTITASTASKSLSGSFIKLVPKENQAHLKPAPSDSDIDLINEIISNHSIPVGLKEATETSQNLEERSNKKSMESNSVRHEPVLAGNVTNNNENGSVKENTVPIKTDNQNFKKPKGRTRTTLSDLKIGENSDKKDAQPDMPNRLRTRSMAPKPTPPDASLIEENAALISKKMNKTIVNGDLKTPKTVKRAYKKKPIEVKSDPEPKKKTTSPMVSVSTSGNQEPMESEPVLQAVPIIVPLRENPTVNKPSSPLKPILPKPTSIEATKNTTQSIQKSNQTSHSQTNLAIQAPKTLVNQTSRSSLGQKPTHSNPSQTINQTPVTHLVNQPNTARTPIILKISQNNSSQVGIINGSGSSQAQQIRNSLNQKQIQNNPNQNSSNQTPSENVLGRKLVLINKSQLVAIQPSPANPANPTNPVVSIQPNRSSLVQKTPPIISPKSSSKSPKRSPTKQLTTPPDVEIKQEKTDHPEILQEDMVVDTPVPAPIVQVNQNKTKNIDQMILKLVYYNTAGSIDDKAFSSILKTYKSENDDDLLQNPNFKSSINKKFIDYIDNELSTRTTQSPLYSLVIETDDTHSAFYTTIQFLDHSNVLREKRLLIKLFDIKPVQEQFKHKISNIFEFVKQNGINEFKLTKYLFEQIKINVIQHFKLNPRNFFCISIDMNILSRLCYSSFQTYLKDLFNKNILILPRVNVQSMINDVFNSFNFKEDTIKFSVKDYFNTYQQILSLTETGKMTGVPFLHKFYFNNDYEFDFNHLADYVKILDSVYLNFQVLANCMNENKSDASDVANAKRELKEKMNKVEFYYMTCLLSDLFKFLYDYKLSAKRFSSLENFVLPWCLDGSYLKNLMCEQLTDQMVQKRPVIKMEEGTSNETIELEDDSLNSLNRIKDSIEEQIRNVLDVCSEHSKIKKHFLDLINTSDSCMFSYEFPAQDLSINIYSYLNEIFDVSFQNIHIENVENDEIKINMKLSDDKIQCIIDYYYYDLRNVITPKKFREQYDLFFKEFINSLSKDVLNELKSDLIDSNAALSKENLVNYTRSLLEAESDIKEKFIEFTNRKKQDTKVSVVSFSALIFLIIPSVVDMERKIKGDKKCLSTLELVQLEHRLKFTDSIKSSPSKENSFISLEKISFSI